MSRGLSPLPGHEEDSRIARWSVLSLGTQLTLPRVADDLVVNWAAVIMQPIMAASKGELVPPFKNKTRPRESAQDLEHLFPPKLV